MSRGQGAKSAEKTALSETRAALGAAVDADLQKLAAAWAKLPKAIKKAILAMVDAAAD